jgi:hypothetical protein
VVMFKVGAHRPIKPGVFCKDDRIENVDSYKYLGVMFYSNIKTYTQIVRMS